MSGTDPTNAPFAEFLDDYFAECDEHLTVARRTSLALEAFVGQPHLNRALLEELFRSFHSVKGLSAMVGVREAEQLAHQMESYLSALRKEQLLLTAEGLDTLIDGVKTLDQVITARRNQLSAPELGPILTKFAALVAGSSAAAGDTAVAAASSGTLDLSADKSMLLAAALQTGAHAWRFMFVPDPGRAERGVNVNTIRKRLQELGDLIHAEPLVTVGGQIAFAFIVAVRADESTFAHWREDGLSWEPFVPIQEEVQRRDEVGATARSGAAAAVTPTNVVRVDLSRLDELMRMLGELVISRARLDDNLKRFEATLPAAEWRSLQETNLAIERQLRDLREGVMRVRLVPIREVFARMQFVVRDLAREFGKKIHLALSGQETEIDKFVVERMMDRLLHLVRNAVCHGLEAPEERVAAGKAPEGTIALRATTTGETIVVEVDDDGRGMDAAAILARGHSSGLLGAQTAVDASAVLDVICAPGFSTRDEADRASGRGVGMAVVRNAVEELGGSLALDTRPGKGTRFTIHLPLTLAIADALIVSVDGQTFAIPQVAVREVLQIEPRTATSFENNEIIPYRDGVLPVVRLARYFGLAERPERAFYALVVGTGLAAVGLAADRVLGLREIVVRPLTDALARAPGISGATELGDGRVVLILDTMALARAVRRPARMNPVSAAAPRVFLGTKA